MELRAVSSSPAFGDIIMMDDREDYLAEGE